MYAPTRICACLIGLFALSGCDSLTQAMFNDVPSGPQSEGHLTIVGAAPLVQQDGMAFAPSTQMPALIAEHTNVATFEARSVANEVSMERLCDPHNAHPDFALLTRSPTHAEVLRCERAGISVSADLLALNRGEWTGFAAFDQIWIVFVPGEIAETPEVMRAVETLRYDFDTLIEGTEYAEVFVARRG